VRREHEVDVPNCQVKSSLNIAATSLLARNETAGMACTIGSAAMAKGRNCVANLMKGLRKSAKHLLENQRRIFPMLDRRGVALSNDCAGLR
jgi:hypothetical protein